MKNKTIIRDDIKFVAGLIVSVGTGALAGSASACLLKRYNPLIRLAGFLAGTAIAYDTATRTMGSVNMLVDKVFDKVEIKEDLEEESV